jgi:hypothetical protein
MTTELLSEAEWLQSIADLDSVALLMGMPAEAVDRYEEILNARGYTAVKCAAEFRELLAEGVFRAHEQYSE